jgi:hypothetical protein
VLVQDRRMVCAECTIGIEIILDAPDGTTWWVMWNLVSVHLEIVLMLVQDRCKVCTNVPSARKPFWTHPMQLLGHVGHVKSRFGPFGNNVCVGAR